ncbi:MAG TPA: hypothetical protein VEO95_07610 [Chthoniobacteraceae bacterium]|nr:hypothetical protein [Chthoniobacteraceae bacterium]
MSERELNLDGAEISVIKAIGLSGTEVSGEDLMSRCPELVGAELIDTLKGLMMLGYVVSDTGSFHDEEDLKRIILRVNSGYSKDLREALNPQPSKARSKRVRRE